MRSTPARRQRTCNAWSSASGTRPGAASPRPRRSRRTATEMTVMEHRARVTHTLIERVPAECRLAPDDVAFLLAEHRAHVEVAPTGRRHRYRLTPAGHVGTIVAPHCRLVIRPKIPLRNFFHLLDAAADVPATEDHTTPAPGTQLFDFLAGRLAVLLAERAAGGLQRGYAERAAHGPFVQGRLDLPAQLREPPGRRDLVHSRFEELTADVPCNQIPKATAELVLRSPLLGEPLRARLRQALAGFDGVHGVPLGPDSFRAAGADPLTRAYRPLFALCQLLA